jgi:hypothetical protein
MSITNQIWQIISRACINYLVERGQRAEGKRKVLNERILSFELNVILLTHNSALNGQHD